MSQVEPRSPMEKYFPKKVGYLKSIAWKISSAATQNQLPRRAIDLFGLFDQDGDLIMICHDLDYGHTYAANDGRQVLTLH